MREIVITGSVAYDYLMRFPGSFRESFLLDKLDKISLSFLVDDMARHWGGAGANIAYNLALLGLRPRLLATAGRDFTDYRSWLEEAGVDTRPVAVIEHVFTASFFANTDQENNQIASFYSGAMAFARDYTLTSNVEVQPDYVVISPNDPQAMYQLVDECITRGIPYMYDPSQQILRLEPDMLRRGIEHCHTLAVNEYEWNLLTRKTGLSQEDVLGRVKLLARTLGKDGAELFADGQRYVIPIFPTENVTDPTGVGDAFRAGLLAGLSHGWPWEVIGRVGSLCSAYAIERIGTQSHRFTPADFVARYRTVWDDGGALNSLL
jgi:adenosine kinase